MCTPVCLPKEELERIKLFPDPMIKDDGYYKSMAQKLLRSADLPSRPIKEATIYASLEHVKNSGLMLMCEECGM